MKIVYFGSDVFLSCFEYIAQRHEVMALYTYHNDEDYFTEYAIVRKARELGVPIHYEAVAPEDTARYFREGCQLYFSAEYDRFIDIPTDLPAFRGVNIHSALLPQGRSYYPIEAAMERGLSRTGVSLHKLVSHLDSGDLLAQREVEIAPDMDSVDVYLRCAAYAREMTEEVLEDLDGAWARALPQTQRLPYWRRPALEKMTLEHSLTRAGAGDMFRRYNALTQVELGGEWYFVTALLSGPAPLGEEERRLAPERWLYRVADGHLRLNVIPKPREGRT